MKSERLILPESPFPKVLQQFPASTVYAIKINVVSFSYGIGAFQSSVLALSPGMIKSVLKAFQSRFSLLDFSGCTERDLSIYLSTNYYLVPCDFYTLTIYSNPFQSRFSLLDFSGCTACWFFKVSFGGAGYFFTRCKAWGV